MLFDAAYLDDVHHRLRVGVVVQRGGALGQQVGQDRVFRVNQPSSSA